jgi:hypothetical protein
MSSANVAAVPMVRPAKCGARGRGSASRDSLNLGPARRHVKNDPGAAFAAVPYTSAVVSRQGLSTAAVAAKAWFDQE